MGGVEVKKHSRIRSADFAQLNEARYRQAEAAALRKISEITEEDLSPVANMRYR